jgi:TatD DNase family protein
LTDLYQHPAEYRNAVEEACLRGVKAVVIIGTGIDDLKKALALSHELEGTLIARAAGGLSPYDVRNADQGDIDILSCLLADDPMAAAVGEIGLDRHHCYSRESVEELFLEQQLDLAVRLNMPVVIHCRKAHSRMRHILKQYSPRLDRKGVIHCFSGTYGDAADYMDMGFRLSFTCALGYRNSTDQRETVRKMPLDSILAETDSPYLPPQSMRGERNQPANVREVIRVIAEIKGLKEENVADTVFLNSCMFFGIEQ